MPPIGLLFFFAIAAVAFVAVRRSLRLTRERRQLQVQHPGEPWMWRHDWAERAVRDETAIKSGFLWFFGIFWILISSPVLLVFRDRADQDPFIPYFLLAFPIVGAIVLIVAAYLTLRRRKYGVSVCRLDRLPVAIGSVFHGEVQARVRDVPESGFQMRFTSVRRIITGSGKNRSTRENILWQDEQTVGSGAAMPNPDGMRIPVRFTIPSDCEPTDDSNPRDSVLWRLEVRAEVPGIDYAARFELPVFRTADAPQTDDWPAQTTTAWTPPPYVVFSLSRTGGEEVVIRPSVAAGDWFGYVFFIALWFGALTLIAHFGAPIWIVSIFGVFGTIVLLAAADILVGRSAIAADRQTLTARRSWLGVGRTRTFAASNVEAVVARIGRSSGASARYNIEARFKDGTARLIATHMAGRRDADGVAARLARAVGVSR